MQAVVAQARVALAPIVYSVGAQNKVLEAMGCGVPVVATWIALEGFLPTAVPVALAADDPREFAAQTIRALTERPIAADYGRRGYDWVTRHYTWQRSAAMFEELYQSAARQDRAA
jgi:glycosyltransferase involved in cell wall biosynthesis